MANVPVVALGQMTFKACGWEPKRAIKEEKKVYLGRVFGEAASYKTKEARNGDTYNYLIGEFRATGLNEGKPCFYESGKLFLPTGAMEQVEAALKTANGGAVKFAYDVFVAPDDKVTIGYRYGFKTLIKTEASNRLADLTADMNDIAAPEEEKAATTAKK